MSDQAIHVLVNGLVQFVGFRFNTQLEASRLGLTGYARNLDDGRVEVVAEGPTLKLQQLADWLEVGPPGADVTQITVTWQEPQGFKGFQIR